MPDDSQADGRGDRPQESGSELTRLSEAEWAKRGTFLDDPPAPVQAAPTSVPDPAAFAPPPPQASSEGGAAASSDTSTGATED
jgi:hypothetical protein